MFYLCNLCENDVHSDLRNSHFRVCPKNTFSQKMRTTKTPKSLKKTLKKKGKVGNRALVRSRKVSKRKNYLLKKSRKANTFTKKYSENESMGQVS